MKTDDFDEFVIDNIMELSSTAKKYPTQMREMLEKLTPTELMFIWMDLEQLTDEGFIENDV